MVVFLVYTESADLNVCGHPSREAGAAITTRTRVASALSEFLEHRRTLHLLRMHTTILFRHAPL